ncbi:MAG: alpha/beta hydrolase, partial [Bacilli bacterium]|nr:alpha/beta hydrolase [Bacilli bacterium]
YIEDPYCGITFSNGSFSALFHLLNWMGKAKRYQDVHADMPILLAGGEEDPCTGGEKGRANSKKVLEKAGFTDISVITYPKMRHEILNEKECAKVYQDILDFMEK